MHIAHICQAAVRKESLVLLGLPKKYSNFIQISNDIALNCGRLSMHTNSLRMSIFFI